MRRILAGCVRAVMAAHAVARDVDVIEVGGYPPQRCMAVIAVIAADDVVGVLARRDHTIVARTASAQHIGVIYGKYRGPAIRCMAVLADTGRQDVCRRLASRVDTIVARDAIAADVCVVEDSRHPCRGVMTVVALLAGGDMIRRLAGCLHPVVACIATPGHRGVVHERDYGPGRRNVTIRALH